MMKAKTALTLSKNYRQDRAMNWGFLTEAEESHLDRKRERARREVDEAAQTGVVEDSEEKGEGPG